MPSPIVTPGRIGSAMPRQTVPPGANAASLVDLATGGLSGSGSGDVEALVAVKAVGDTDVKVPVFAFYPSYGQVMLITSFVAPQTLALAGDAVSDIDPGQQIMLLKDDGSRLGETVTVASVEPGGVVTLSAPPRLPYEMGDHAMLFVDRSIMTALGSAVGPFGGAPVGGYLYLTTGRWVVEATNLDSSQAVTVVATAEKLRGYA